MVFSQLALTVNHQSHATQNLKGRKLLYQTMNLLMDAGLELTPMLTPHVPTAMLES